MSQPPLNGNMRQSISGRQSLGPSRISRVGSSQNMAPSSQNASSTQPDPKGRLSMYGANPTDGRFSISGYKFFTSFRRNSLGGVRKSSVGLGGPSLNAPPKDPRPVRDKNFQLNCIKTLIEFLAKSGYDKPISSKILTAPSSKDFQNIFKFLYARIDPTYEFGKKFEEEVPILIKSIRYPYANDISKSQLYAVGSMHAWPSLLAMLCWFVELIMCLEGECGNEVGVNESTSEWMFFVYLCKAYKLFLTGDDNFDEPASELKASFEQKNRDILKAIEFLSEEVTDLSRAYRSYTDEESPLQKVERESKTYSLDVIKFSKFIGHLQEKKEKTIDQLNRLNQDGVLAEHELSEIESQRQQLQAQVDAQNICPEDIDKMNSEKEQSIKTLNSLNQMKEEALKIFWDRELSVQKKIDAIEKLVQEYNFSAEKIGIVPKDATNANGQDFELLFNPHAVKSEHVLNLILREGVLLFLNSLRDHTSNAVQGNLEKLELLMEETSRFTEALEDKSNELHGLEQKIIKLNQQYILTKEGFQAENRSSNDEFDILQSELNKIRSEMSAGFLSSQQALQKMTMTYDQTMAKICEEKDRAGREIFRVLEELINFKTLIEVSLNEINSAYQKDLQ